MNIRKTSILGVCFAFAVLPSLAQAHYLWAVLSPNRDTLTVGLQENPDLPALSLNSKAQSVKAWSASGLKIDLKPTTQSLAGILIGRSAGVSLDYGVIDRREDGRGVFWLRYYAKAAANPAASQKLLGLPFELTLTKSVDVAPVVHAISNGKPAASADIVVESPSGDTIFQGKTDADGNATLPTLKAPYAVRALITSNAKGNHDGHAYELSRTYTTLTVAGDDIALKATDPFTLQMHNSFGDDHSIVSTSAFIDSALNKTLTRQQLIDHLQQRALIHEALDRILSNGKVSIYGAQQKELLTLLKADMKKANIPWPSAKDAWPITQAFLDELNASAKQGPWYALGVFHVYYGGITHGGRYIGEMINDGVGVYLDYYEKSDGYDAYAAEFNKITDPKAREEILRGGIEAYRSIIAFNDEPAFETKASTNASAKDSSAKHLSDEDSSARQ